MALHHAKIAVDPSSVLQYLCMSPVSLELFAETSPRFTGRYRAMMSRQHRWKAHCHGWYHALGALLSKFLLVVLQLVYACLRGIWVQLEGMPSHLNLPLALRSVHNQFKVLYCAAKEDRALISWH